MELIKKERIRRLEWLNSRLYPPIKVGLLEKTIHSIAIYYFLQSAWLVVRCFKLETFEMKIKLFETIIVSILVVGIITDLYFNMGCGSAVQQALDMDYFIRYTDDEKSQVEEKLQYIKNQEESACKEVDTVRMVLIVSGSAYLSIHIKNFIELITTDNKPFEKLSYPNLVYIPFTGTYLPFDSLSFIFTVFAQTAMFYAISIGAIMVYANLKFSIRCLTDEIGLFMKSLYKFDELCSKQRMLEFSNGNGINAREYNIYSATSYKDSMRTIRDLSIHHQIIFKKRALLNESCRFRMIYTNVFICLQLSVSVFCFQIGDLLIKIRYGFFLVVKLLFIFIYSNDGQSIIDKFEEMRQALHNCSWYDMPQSVQKSIVLIMVRNTNYEPMRVFDIIRMDRSNFVNMVRAIYSYFNLLKRFY